jgi:hypothetical protein
VPDTIENFLRIASLGKSCDKNSRRAPKREFDGIVHRLFPLTPAEIALIEEAVGPKN